MRTDVYDYVKANPQIHKYLRTHPVWYRRLGREPERLPEMIKESNVYYGKTFPQRVEQIQRNMNLAMMMIEMMKQVKEP
ncbi:YlbE-like family protein [Salipaludibacillus aurantiacus]|uniref:YlbE-like protein n=1 Tax=Salipaludibacillus aurantiacus TaxID=1601833 RepID=A0A1H9X277_9BACI|nr:YlbE-like family protein [Salipaludibacillus aurantiacus]SES39743.1 YlbE-like protein [Salipaludibacillus aurantiacus]